MEIKIRYTFKHSTTNIIEFYYHDIKDIEKINGLQLTFGWKIIGRDLFTGLKDKNGKDIYENDIANSSAFKNALVYFDKDCLGLFVKYFNGYEYESIPLCENKNIEIIGNIYHNPELLEQL